MPNVSTPPAAATAAAFIAGAILASTVHSLRGWRDRPDETARVDEPEFPFAELCAMIEQRHRHLSPERIAQTDRVETAHRVLFEDFGVDLDDPTALVAAVAAVCAIDEFTAETAVGAHDEGTDFTAPAHVDVGQWLIRSSEGVGKDAVRQLLLGALRRRVGAAA